MLEFGDLTGFEIEKNKDAEIKTVLLQLRVLDDNNGETIELQNLSGVDNRPPSGARVFFIPVSESYQVAVCVDDHSEPAQDIEEGEQEFYSLDAGARMATIRFKKDGDLILNAGDRTLTAYEQLKQEFDKLKQDFNNLVNMHNAHIHITTATVAATPTPGVIAPTTSVATPTTADISGAQVKTIKVK